MSVLQESGQSAISDETYYLVEQEDIQEVDDEEEYKHPDLMNRDEPTSVVGLAAPTISDGHQDARALVRLIQCPTCSLPLRSPVTLPCGISLCRQCLPTSYTREHVSYPDVQSRRQAIQCPFADCQQEHTLEDCAVNVVLTKLLDSIVLEVVRQRSSAGETQTMLEEVPAIRDPSLEGPSEKMEGLCGHSRTLPGARLASTYTLAEMGELDHTAEVIYKDAEPAGVAAALDMELLGRLKEAVQKDLDCHVCYNLMLNPVTTPCGHTFCRKCLARILDHADMCPICRRNLPLPASLTTHPDDKSLSQLLLSLCLAETRARDEAAIEEERSAPGGLDTALFLVAVNFPSMPVLLHVFEPRYRLMIRRAMETTGQFGMVAHNQHGHPQGSMGRTRFMEMGVLVQIEHFQTLPDGRSFLQCRGISRFRIVAHGMLDGYVMGRIQKVEDISLAEEEQLEARELGAALAVPPTEQNSTSNNNNILNLDRVSTSELFAIGQNFVQRARERSAPWLQGRIIDVYGGPPDDPAVFPYWFASVLPLHEDEKYKLLPTMSVRERLKITARWVQRIEAQRWYV
jgi:Lon protease-like protein